MARKYQVGYGKPPKHTRFRKGESGNSNGRPKGSKNLKTDLKEVLQEKFALKEGDTRKVVSKQRGMIMRLLAIAIQGDVRAAALLAKLILQLLPEEGAVGLSEGLGDDDLEILDNYEKRLRRTKPRPKKRMKSPRKVTGARDKHSAKKRKKEKNR